MYYLMLKLNKCYVMLCNKTVFKTNLCKCCQPIVYVQLLLKLTKTHPLFDNYTVTQLLLVVKLAAFLYKVWFPFIKEFFSLCFRPSYKNTFKTYKEHLRLSKKISFWFNKLMVKNDYFPSDDFVLV